MTAKPKQLTCYYCAKPLEEDEAVIKPIPMHTKRGIRKYKRKFHYDCLAKFEDGREKERKSLAENSDWEKVYEYFKTDILNLPPGATLSEHTVSRLMGLRVGMYKPSMNTRITKHGYSFEVILLTLEFCHSAIVQAIKRTKFNNEQHMIDYIMKIVQNNINFVQKRVDQYYQQKERVEKMHERDKAMASPEVKVEYKRKGTGRKKYDLV